MFTSRLPKSTSARRPSNPNDGSTSLIGSNIPISVRKANLFTPQPKRSLQGGYLNSTSRKSFMTTDKKYQRTSKPAPDRDEQLRMFENLVDLLRTFDIPNFPIPEAKRFFSSVSTTECTRIFEILISKVMGQEFKISKLEIDVPEALAMLEYPYMKSVTKSALISVTTRQAIVNLLVIFDWLVTGVKIATGDFCNLTVDPTMDLNQRAFVCLMTSNNPGADIEMMFEDSDGGSKLESELENINANIERIAEEVQEHDELELEIQSIAEDLQTCAKYEEDMKQYIRTKQGEEADLKQEIAALDVQISKMSQEYEILLPSVDCETDNGVACDPVNLLRLEEEIKSRVADIEVEKLDRNSAELDGAIRKHNEDLEKLNARKMHLEKELTNLVRTSNERLEAKRAEVKTMKELNDRRLQQCAEKCMGATLSIVERAEENVEFAKRALELAKEDTKSLRSVARRVKCEV